MLRSTILTTTCALFIASSAFAQTNTTAEQPPATSVTTKNMFGQPSTTSADATNTIGFIIPKDGQLLVSTFIGQTIYDSDANDAASVGKLNDLITSADGQIEAAVIGVGGFLGVGEKDVAVSPDVLQLATRNDDKKWLFITATKEELNNAPAFDRSLYFSEGVADPTAAVKQQQQDTTEPMPTTPLAPADETSPTAPAQ